MCLCVYMPNCILQQIDCRNSKNDRWNSELHIEIDEKTQLRERPIRQAFFENSIQACYFLNIFPKFCLTYNEINILIVCKNTR